MEAKDYLAYISQVIHTTVVATVDQDGLPVTAAIDMMDADENGLYFLTAKGKSFYMRLKRTGYLALTAIKGEDTMSSVAVSVRGKVRELGAFSFGGQEPARVGYRIGPACIGCGSCMDVCPQDCIVADDLPFVIEQDHCLHCGNCLNVRPVGAVELLAE